MTSPPPSPPVHFVVAAARSGTTWLATALQAHPEILATENRLFGDFCELWAGKAGPPQPRISADRYLRCLSWHLPAGALGLTADQLHDQLVSRWVGFLNQMLLASSGKRMVIDKVTPWAGTAVRTLDSIRRWCPEATVSFLVRDGRDVAVSALFDSLYRRPGRPLRRRMFLEGRPKWRLDRLWDDELLIGEAKYWNELAALVLNHPGHLCLRYEAMQADQAAELGKLCFVIGADAGDETLRTCAGAAQFQRMAGKPAGSGALTDKARRGRVGDWRNWMTREDGRLFEAVAGDSLRRLGYEADPSWFEQLPERLAWAAEGTSSH